MQRYRDFFFFFILICGEPNTNNDRWSSNLVSRMIYVRCFVPKHHTCVFISHAPTAGPAIPSSLYVPPVSTLLFCIHDKNTSINAQPLPHWTTGHVSLVSNSLGINLASDQQLDIEIGLQVELIGSSGEQQLSIYNFKKKIEFVDYLLQSTGQVCSSLEFYHRPFFRDPTFIGGNASIAWLTRYRFRFVALWLCSPPLTLIIHRFFFLPSLNFLLNDRIVPTFKMAGHRSGLAHFF